MPSPDTCRRSALSALVAGVVLAILAVGGVLLPNDPGTPAVSAADAGADAGSDRRATDAAAGRAAATAALAALERAAPVQGRAPKSSAAAFDRVFARTEHARHLADRLWSNLDRLPLSAYSLRHLADLPDGDGRRRRAEVRVRWALAGHEARAASSVVEVTFVGAGRRARIAEMVPADSPAPAWLLGRLRVETVGRAVVLALRPQATGAVRALVAQTRQAVADVHEVLPDWDRRLVVVLPASTRQFARLLAADAGRYADTAAVTTAVDGRSGHAAPVRVLLNPQVFTASGPVAGRVVLAHEATHVAADDISGDAPPWLAEGFADYVALRDAPVPVEVLAGRALDLVRRSGPPRRLPDGDEFAPEAPDAAGPAAAHESAWLACRLVAERHGEAALVRLDRVARRAGVEVAFESVLGTDTTAFTRQWRSHLRELAR